MEKNRIILIASIILVGCDKRDTEPKIDAKSLASAEAQAMLWYNTANSLRKNVEPSWKIDVAIVNNFFPYFLARKSHGINQAQLSIAAAAYDRLGRKKVESSIWTVREDSYSESVYASTMQSFGFDWTQIDTFEKLQKLKAEYLDALDAFEPSR